MPSDSTKDFVKSDKLLNLLHIKKVLKDKRKEYVDKVDVLQKEIEKEKFVSKKAYKLEKELLKTSQEFKNFCVDVENYTKDLLAS